MGFQTERQAWLLKQQELITARDHAIDGTKDLLTEIGQLAGSRIELEEKSRLWEVKEKLLQKLQNRQKVPDEATQTNQDLMALQHKLHEVTAQNKELMTIIDEQTGASLDLKEKTAEVAELMRENELLKTRLRKVNT